MEAINITISPKVNNKHNLLDKQISANRVNSEQSGQKCNKTELNVSHETQIPSRRYLQLGQEESGGGVGEGRGVHQGHVLHESRLRVLGARSAVRSRSAGDGEVEVLTDCSD